MGTMVDAVGAPLPPFAKCPASPSAAPLPPSPKHDAAQKESPPLAGVPVSIETYGTHMRVLPTNRQVKELQTIIRDKNTSRSDFKFYADRLIRLVIEEGLNQLPYESAVVTTPTGSAYEGLAFVRGNCGVSVVRSGEAMEQGLRLCCRSIRIGKILVESDADTHEARVVYAKFPDDIAVRKVLLMYPIMSSGNTVAKSMRVLKEHSVKEENVVLLNLFCTPQAAKTVTDAFPKMQILTSEVHAVAPNHFGQKYFGTD